MIRRLYAAWLRMRAQHHADRAQIFAMANNAARERRDFITAAFFWSEFEKSRSKRDVLTLRASSLYTPALPACCDGNCGQGRRCTARYR